MQAGVVLTVFALVAVAELPDKTMIATLVLGSRHRPVLVWAGASAAFAVHVCLAVAAGRLIDLLPHTALEAVVSGVFFAAGVLLLVLPERHAEARGEAAAAHPPRGGSWGVVGTAFAVIAVGELGDLTQLLTVDLAAKYHQPWSVGVGAFTALVAVAALGAFGGRALLRWVPVQWVRRGAGLILLGLAAYTVYGLAT